ncbi:putative DMT superfamily transporter inner membrane protein [Slackia heliotrinireducens]|uniref:DMT(Drug/metabolite transporter) superfamily permease n=1 Tax=Slackia heliotrinireducens (strain ATCC 29202 / DSM 20476 / NCTC 11029 / RHS 1) TaxID=471855 RepID=C7N2I6_SLAHD|nr:DMT family transporter [Slackia heliotrinireducens]ACV23494.1 DMT(drug/metabolite transporter) superfamily permease [Slackia heliotrinireducens DSM 20476]VEH02855.1 putative DMT superfamily transporter inner membrane protein [Slackia heliotrinireducens]
MKYKLLLVLATLIWGSSFVMVKDLTDVMAPAWLLAIRFVAATVVMAAVCLVRREPLFDREHIKYGIIIGLPLFMGYLFQTIGITDTTPGKNAFLTATYCVIVPFLTWAVDRKRPNRFNIVAALLCLSGIGLISLTGSFTIGFGDAMTLCCAVFYAVQILFMSKFGKGRNVVVLTVWQFATVTAGSLMVALVSAEPPTPAAMTPGVWLSFAYLAFIVTALAVFVQNIGLANVEPATGGLLLSLESVFGVAFSIALGREPLTPRILVGFVVVFVAMVASEYLPAKLERRRTS